MIHWLTEPFAPHFMQRALLAGALAAVTTSVVGTWMVLRGLSFMGDALAHGVLPGIAVAFLLGTGIVLGATVGALVMVAGISMVNRQTRLSEDTAIGLLFVGMLALGVIVISRSESFAVSLTAFLFGDVLGVSGGDLLLEAGAAAATTVAAFLAYRPFLVLSFNADKAEVLGLRPRLAHAAMLVLVALAVVTSFKAVGTLLVFGLLVAPPAAASLLVRRVPAMMATSAVLGVLSVVVGLAVSYHAATAASATIAGIAVALFFAVLTGRAALDAITRRRAGAVAPAGGRG